MTNYWLFFGLLTFNADALVELFLLTMANEGWENRGDRHIDFEYAITEGNRVTAC